MTAPPSDLRYEAARPLWAEIDLDAIAHNVRLLRARVGRPIKILAPVKANAYGHGIEAVSRHLAQLGVEGLATANIDDAMAVRRAGVSIPILMYGSHLNEGLGLLLDYGLTPTVYSKESLQALAALAGTVGRRVGVHVKVDAGLGRLGVRLDETAEFVRCTLAHPKLHLEGIYTHIPFSDAASETVSYRRLAAFADVVRGIESEHGISIDFVQGAASSVLARAFPDPLNTIAPGHLVYGLCPIDGERAETLGFRKALRRLRARLIHVGRRRRDDDLIWPNPNARDGDVTTGVVLLGMDNGYRNAPDGRRAYMLCRGRRCPVLAVSAEYTVIDVSQVPAPAPGDTVTVVGDDGGDSIAIETVAEQLGAPSAAYWMVEMRRIPFRYVGGV
jgi:alanine racemase